MSTDQPASGSARESRQQELRSVFVEVTGTEEFVTEQEQETSGTRDVTAGGAASAETLSEYVSAMVRADGLAETYDDPESESGG
ncbi:hypothetical protein [Haloarcula amylovorans]|uniref:hypothetical protein n=1 Tax=Haloarcula amylovorans TaxID=2562280 RepID=UPI001076036C|nr:hypothetical protein [Halomicroarcula amylolytica]